MIPDSPARGALAPARVLVVDDNPDVAGIVRLAVGKLPRRVEVASEVNADRALERVRSEEFDLVLGDFRMREMDGLQFLARAREARPQGRHVLFTAHAGKLDPAALARAHVDGVLEKPTALPELRELLGAILNRDAATLAAMKRGVDARTGGA